MREGSDRDTTFGASLNMVNYDDMGTRHWG